MPNTSSITSRSERLTMWRQSECRSGLPISPLRPASGTPRAPDRWPRGTSAALTFGLRSVRSATAYGAVAISRTLHRFPADQSNVLSYIARDYRRSPQRKPNGEPSASQPA
jgi:hypothetical protein